VGRLLISILSKLPPPGRRVELMYRGTFRPDRVKSVADRYGVDGNMALENVLCARAWSSEQQCELLLELAVK
jgi:meiotic recombination protein DMC1